MDYTHSQSSDGYTYGSGSNFDHSISYGVSDSWTECSSKSISRSQSWAGTPSRVYCGDPAYIAQQVFRDEVRDILRVLKNCGVLGTADERRWCLEQLTQLLAELDSSDLGYRQIDRP
jgi:hypothetical protein